MRIIVCYTRIHRDADTALRQFAPNAERIPLDVDDPHAYWRALSDVWAAGEDFISIEHDVVLGSGTIAELESCPEPWCSAGQWWWCWRARAELMRAVPDAFDRLEWRQRAWVCLDTNWRNAMRDLGHHEHLHGWSVWQPTPTGDTPGWTRRARRGPPPPPWQPPDLRRGWDHKDQVLRYQVEMRRQRCEDYYGPQPTIDELEKLATEQGRARPVLSRQRVIELNAERRRWGILTREERWERDWRELGELERAYEARQRSILAASSQLEPSGP